MRPVRSIQAGTGGVVDAKEDVTYQFASVWTLDYVVLQTGH